MKIAELNEISAKHAYCVCVCACTQVQCNAHVFSLHFATASDIQVESRIKSNAKTVGHTFKAAYTFYR